MTPKKKITTPITDTNFAQTLIKLRTARGMSQSDLAYLLHKASGTAISGTMTQIRKWEEGTIQPNMRSLTLLIKVLGCTLVVQEEE